MQAAAVQARQRVIGNSVRIWDDASRPVGEHALTAEKVQRLAGLSSVVIMRIVVVLSTP
jgi:hypothetical protein